MNLPIVEIKKINGRIYNPKLNFVGEAIVKAWLGFPPPDSSVHSEAVFVHNGTEIQTGNLRRKMRQAIGARYVRVGFDPAQD